MWSAKKSSCLSTLRTHKDYVSCLAYSTGRNQVFSGGYDNQVYLWDMAALTALTIENSTITCTNLRQWEKFNCISYQIKNKFESLLVRIIDKINFYYYYNIFDINV